MDSKFKIWDDFCRQHHVLDEGVPLFGVEGDLVSALPYGNDHHLVLERSMEMEKLVTQEVGKVISDFKRGANVYEGLIYTCSARKTIG